MADAKKKDDAEMLQLLMDENEALKKERADLIANQVDAEPDKALEYLKAIAAAAAKPQTLTLAPRAVNVPFTMTDKRRADIEAILKKSEGNGLEYSFADVNFTIRKSIKARVVDPETGERMWERRWKSECIHCSTPDMVINRLVKFFLLV